jgi:RNA polymerase sigma factor (sigma-70 family)
MAAKPLAAVVRYLHNLVGSGAGEPSDADLLALFADRRESAAFELLVRRHGPLVMGVSRRVLGDGPDVDDVFQATFLVLARKAGRIRKKEAIGSWLHGVAHHLSLKLRKKHAVRRRHEFALGHHAETRPMSVDPSQQASLRELGAILDEELERLPEDCRAAIVACHLEGQSTAEAAHNLGVHASTLKSRLQRGREMLRKTLERRGVGLSAMGLAVVLAEQSRAAVAYALVRSTVEAAVSFAVSGVASVSSQAASLAATGLKTTLLGKVKLTVLAVLTFGVLGLGAAVVPTLAPPDLPDKGLIEGRKEEVQKLAVTDQFGDPLPAGAIARVGTIRWRHDRVVDFAEFLPDGKSVITVGNDLTIRVWEWPSGKEIRRIAQPGREYAILENDFRIRHFSAAALSPDGKILATCFGFTEIRLHEVATDRELPTIQVPSPAASIAFSTRGNELVCLDYQGTLHIWDWAKTTEIRKIRHQDLVNRGPSSHCKVAYSPDGKSLATFQYEDFKSELRPVLRIREAATGVEVFSNGTLSGALGGQPRVKVLSFFSRREIAGLFHL